MKAKEAEKLLSSLSPSTLGVTAGDQAARPSRIKTSRLGDDKYKSVGDYKCRTIRRTMLMEQKRSE